MSEGVGAVEIAGMGVDCAVTVAADQGRVWRVVSDIEVPARFSPELQRVRWLDGARGPALGARFEGFNRNDAIGEWRTESHVVECDEPRAFGWAVVDADRLLGDVPPDPAAPMATWRFEVVAVPAGCLVRHAVRFGPAPSGLTVAMAARPGRERRVLDFRLGVLRSGIEQTLQGVKRITEGGA